MNTINPVGYEIDPVGDDIRNKKHTLSRDDIMFMSDAENWVLEKLWWNESREKTIASINSKKRLTNELWKKLILENTEINWEKYEVYVNFEYGDDWFICPIFET